MIEVDATDRRILRTLQTEGRITNAELADRVNLSPSPCLRRVKRLEEAGVLTGYGARLDRERLGWTVLSFVQINIEKHTRLDADAFGEAVRKVPQVVCCFGLAGATDVLLQVVARDLDDYFDVLVNLGELPGVKDIQSSIVIKELKPLTGLPVTESG